jgi:DNA repair protein RecO (recombination protein O)
MFVTTKGIVLRTYPFKDNKLISKIYTEDRGLVSFIIRKNKDQIILSQPLNIVEITYRESNTHSLFYITDCSADYVYRDLMTNGEKLSFALLISEVLNKCLTEINIELFHFIINSFKWFDNTKGSIQGFDILFLIKFCNMNGIQPSSINLDLEAPYALDIIEGKYINNIININLPHIIPQKESAIIYELSILEYDNLSMYTIVEEKSSIILDYLIKYISIHLADISKLNSIKILKQLI